MTADQEKELKQHLAKLDAQVLKNAKAHADLADHEEHDSFKTLMKWVGSVLGIVGTAGITWKAIKIIKNH